MHQPEVPVTYTLARSVEQACAALSSGDGQIIGGGTDYFPAKVKGAPVPPLVDVSWVSEMQGITETDEGWRIGGAATWTDLIKHPMPRAFDGLKAAAREVGSIQIQNVATLSGNLCNASPAADGVPPLLTLDAAIELTSHRGVRRLPLAAFITGPRQTERANDEILTAILVPHQNDNAISQFEKLGSRRYLVISITMTSLVLEIDDAGLIEQAKLAIGACSAVAQRQPEIELSLVGQKAAEVRITPDQLEHLAPLDDIRGNAGYRLIAAAEQCERAIRKAAAQ